MNAKIMLSIFIAVGCLFSSYSCRNHVGNIIDLEEEQLKFFPKYTSLSRDEIKLRDSLIEAYEKNPVYKTLFLDSLVSVEYLPIVDQLGQILLMSTDQVFTLEEEKVEAVSGITGAKEFLLDAGSLQIKTGYFINGYSGLIERYKRKFGPWGETFVQTYHAGDHSGKKPVMKYNLFLGNLYLNPEDKSALSAMTFAITDRTFSFGTNNKDYVKGRYFYPQFQTRDAFMTYLKRVYPNSFFIPKYEYDLDANELMQAYIENEVIADNQFKSKAIRITGTIRLIAKDAFDNPYVSLETSEPFNVVLCNISIKDAVKLKRHYQVSLIGTCRGMTLRQVVVDNCSIN